MKYFLLLILTSCGSFSSDGLFLFDISSDIGGTQMHVKGLRTQAGAISSITWDGVEFIADYTHGASLQSAVSYDGLAEALNPTEAGSLYDDNASNPSTSQVQVLRQGKGNISTITKMAYWEGGLSPDILNKQVRIGYLGMTNVIQINVQYMVQDNHKYGVFEALTGYMPDNFTRYFVYDRNTAQTTELGSGGGSTDQVIVTCDANESHCMAIVDLTGSARVGSFGQQFFGGAESATKWNTVHYITDVPAGIYSFEMLVVMGSMTDVQTSLAGL